MDAKVFDAVCEKLAEGLSLREIYAIEGMPSPWSVLRVVRSSPEQAQQYAQARELQAELLADELIQIADDSGFDVKLVLGVPSVDGECIARARLRVDTRKWKLSKLLPKVYGERKDVDITSGGQPIGKLLRGISVEEDI